MEMNVDRHRIRSERELRAWSQEHLAAVADLGVRTIQRIEASGQASYESARSIAAAFEMPVSNLISAKASRIDFLRTPGSRIAKATATVAASLIVAGGLLLGEKALAKDVMLNVGFTVNSEERMARLLTAEGKDVEIRIPGLFRLVIIPTIRPDGLVHLSTRIYESTGSDFVLLSEPKLATANDKEAKIVMSTDRGNTFRVLITPHVQ